MSNLDGIPRYGPVISCQRTGGILYDEVVDLLESAKWGMQMDLYTNKTGNHKILFKIVPGNNYTTGDKKVIIDTNASLFSNSNYKIDTKDEINVALVAGEGEGADRKYKIVGNNDATHLDRKELFVDARDLQKEYYDADGNECTMSDTEYEEMLVQRGNEKMAEYGVVESYTCEIFETDGSQFKFGEDYSIGDIVIVKDRILGVEVKAQVRSVTEEWNNNEYKCTIMFGFDTPSLYNKVRRMI